MSSMDEYLKANYPPTDKARKENIERLSKLSDEEMATKFREIIFELNCIRRAAKNRKGYHAFVFVHEDADEYRVSITKEL